MIKDSDSKIDKTLSFFSNSVIEYEYMRMFVSKKILSGMNFFSVKLPFCRIYSNLVYK